MSSSPTGRMLIEQRVIPAAVVLSISGMVAAAVVGCRGPEPTVKLEVCGDVHVPGHVDAVRVRLLGEERETRREGVVELLQCPQATVRSLPHTVTFRPVDGDAWAVVQALKRGRVVGRFEKRVELDPDATTSVRLALNRDCLGISCPTGQTCIAGACEVAPYQSRSSTVCESSNLGGTLRDAGMADTGDVAARARPDTGVGETDPEVLCGSTDVGPSNDASSPPDGEDESDRPNG